MIFLLGAHPWSSSWHELQNFQNLFAIELSCGILDRAAPSIQLLVAQCDLCVLRLRCSIEGTRFQLEHKTCIIPERPQTKKRQRNPKVQSTSVVCGRSMAPRAYMIAAGTDGVMTGQRLGQLRKTGSQGSRCDRDSLSSTRPGMWEDQSFLYV